MKFILGLALAVLVLGCGHDKNDSIIQTEMNSTLKSHCLGHSIIDLPEEYSLKSGVTASFTPDQNEVEDGNIDLVLKPQTDPAGFKKQVAERHAELADDTGMTSKLSQARDLPGGAKLFRVQVIDDAYRSELHWMLNGSYLVATIKSFKNQVAQAETMLLDFSHLVEYRKADGAPPASFYLDGIAVKGKYRSELASFVFASAKAPDISFSVDVNTYEKDDAESLHQRLAGPNALLGKFNIKESVLRKAERNVAGMRAQEWGSVIRPGEKGNDQDLSFLLETIRPVPSAAAPKIHLEMDVTGKSANDQKGALALWDRVVGTIGKAR